MEELTGVYFTCLGWQGWQLVAAVFHTAITSTAEAQQTVAVGRAESSEPLWQVCCASLQQDVVTAAKSHCAGCACNLLWQLVVAGGSPVGCCWQVATNGHIRVMSACIAVMLTWRACTKAARLAHASVWLQET
jgi:hypothetical protein